MFGRKLDFRLPSNQGYWKPRNIEQTHTACRAKHCFCRPPLPRRTVFSTGTRPVEMLSAQILIAHISQCDRSLIRNFLPIWTIKKQLSAVKETVWEYSNSKEFRLDSRGYWFLKFDWVYCSSCCFGLLLLWSRCTFLFSNRRFYAVLQESCGCHNSS